MDEDDNGGSNEQSTGAPDIQIASPDPIVADAPAPRRELRQLSIGTKSLSLDPVWSQCSVADIEFALLRNAVLPEAARANGLDHEIIIVDPSTGPEEPAHDDLVIRLTECAGRLNLRTMVIGHYNSRHFRGGSFTTSLSRLSELPEAGQVEAFAAARERIGWIISATRFSRKRHLFFPVCDASLYAIVLDLLAQQPAASRPFVHLATWWDPEHLPNRARFPNLERVGSAIHQLNTERVSTFLYAWTRPLAQRLSRAFGTPVVPLETPPEISLATVGEGQPERLSVGFLSAPTPGNGFMNLPSIVRASNAMITNPRQVRFVVQVRPNADGSPVLDGVHATRGQLASIGERNVSLIDEALERPVYFAALQQLDALLLPVAGMNEHHSVAALHAMAAGKLVLTLGGTSFAGTVKNCVMVAPTVDALAELIVDAAQDLPATRTAARLARAAFWSTVRPSRMFAQLLYGPLIIGGAEGSNAI